MYIKLSSAQVYHVIGSLLFLLVPSNTQHRCDNHVVCRGERPLLLNGCCPVDPGHICQPINGTSCDAQLGFSCVNSEGVVTGSGTGVCQGRHNLHVTAVGEKNISLAWSDFTPPGYEFEYVLLLRERTYHNDSNQWKKKEIGNQPYYTLKNLTSATLYFIKVAVWEDTRAPVLGTSSETIMVNTLAVGSCEHRDYVYQVGEQFVHNCEDNCTCLPTGLFDCRPLCSDTGVPELAEGCEIIDGDACCEYRVACPVAGEPCLENGQSYFHGEIFEIGCRSCTCNQGWISCEYPEFCHNVEPTESCPFPTSRDIEDQCCPEWYCANTCSYENQTHSHHEYFTSNECGLCQCNTMGIANCTTDCPPVVMILPDAACPDPHIRRNGCCDTLYCHDYNLDLITSIRRMFALSYSPETLTLSFEVDPQVEVNGVPLYCEYEILYANTSDPSVTWTRRLIQPIDVRLHNDQPYLLEPMEALTRDNAIVVGDRAYITLSGMHPNTTYYVKIIPLDGNFDDTPANSSGNYSHSNSKTTAMVVVKTKALDNITSCFYNGKEVLHGGNINSHCSEICTCFMGKITCHSTCESEFVAMAKSSTCPQPRLEKHGVDCCPKWTCYPSASGCQHNGLIMESGQSVLEECQICTCLNASIHCRSVCPPPGSPPRPECKLVNISGSCCPQWQCLLESHPPYGMKSSVLIHFYGSCQTSDHIFQKDMKRKILNHVTSHMVCSGHQEEDTSLCNSIQVAIFCPAFLEGLDVPRKRRSTNDGREYSKISVVVSMYRNFSSTASNYQTSQYVKSVSLQLVPLLNSSFSILLDNGQVMTSLDGAQFIGESFVCDHSFTFVKGSCILSEIESSPSLKPNLQLILVKVTSHSVILEWQPLADHLLKHIIGLLVEHRKDGSVQWFSSGRLDSTTTSYNLTELSPDQNYSARLIVLTAWPGIDTWKIGEVHFRTKSMCAAVALSSSFNLIEITVTETCAFFYWDQLPDQSLVTSVDIFYKQTHQEPYQKKQHISPVTKSYVKLKNLHPNTAYTAKLIVLMSSDTTITYHPVHFVTLAPRNSSTELLITVVVSCIVTVVTCVILSLTCIIWWRSRKREKDNGFENKVFGIQLENNNGGVNVEPAANPALN